jgi:hypothetical protein
MEGREEGEKAPGVVFVCSCGVNVPSTHGEVCHQEEVYTLGI